MRRSFRPLAASLLFHAVLLGVIAVWLAPRQRVAPPAVVKSAAPAAPGVNGSSPAAAAEGILQHLETELAAAERQSPERQMQSVLDKARQLERISSVESMTEIAELLRRKLPTGPRAFAPAERPVAGAFDYSDPVIHSVIRKRDERGVEKPFYVMVDKAGRKVEVEAPPGSETTVALYERLQSSPVLRSLKDGILLPVLDWQAKPK